MTAPVKTLCPYCGVGCGLEVSPVEPASTKPPNKSTGKSTGKSAEPSPDLACQSWKVRGDRAHPSSLGMVCVKGATVAEPLERDRLLHPMMRDSLEEPFRRATWEEAYDRIVTHIQTVRTARGADALCMYGSGQFQTEDYYVAQKLMKGCLGTNNFDANSRLCMSSAVSGYIQSLGSDGPPCCYDDLELTDCAFLIGTNTAECHPIVFNRLRKHHKQNRNVKMIVVDPRRTPTAEAADLHLAIRPGTDIDLLNGIAYLLFHWGAIDAQFIDECTSGYPEFVKVIKQYAPERVARVCGIDAKEVEAAARYWRAASRPLSLWSMGINQSSEGTAKARSIINLHLMTGTIGKPGCGPFSLTGQPNAMGGREAGGLSHLLPGYRSVKDPQHRAEVEKAWNLPAGQISSHPGRSTWDIITGLESGDVEFVWIAATNPAVSLPDLERAKKALMRSPLTVYQETYYPTETAAYAHILLPTTQWSEKAGTMTNSERRVTFCPAFREPMGEAKTDWEIFAEVGRRLGFAEQFWFRSASDVRREFVELTRDRPCEQSALTHEFLQEHGPTQWPQSLHDPIPTDRTPAKRLYTDHHFPTPDGCARFSAYHSKGLFEPPDPAFPFVLTIGRLYGHWHTQARTGRIEKIRQMHPNPFLEIHPRDAEQLNITEGALVEVRSRRGMVCCPALITRGIAPGTVFLPMHWGFLWAELAEANTLTHSAACPDSLEPELKACAVQLKLLKAAPVEPRQTNRLIATIRGMAQGLFSE